MKKLVFNKYSEYYDLIYEDKNYKKEVKYIDELIQKLHPGAKTILDIGCGTGIHANLLASLGYKVLGVDFSEQMIQIANSKKLIEYKENHDLLEFKTGDIRKIDLHDKFDVVVSLFHVISYLNSNQDLNDGLNTIYKHLKTRRSCNI
jgi:predicted TPR repeat methyltransferase